MSRGTPTDNTAFGCETCLEREERGVVRGGVRRGGKGVRKRGY